jgi:hypothetical protein
MIDKDLYEPEELIIFRAYGDRCVIHPWAWADALHEEPPRSLNPRWKEEPEKRFPLCYECHELIQSMPRDQAAEHLAKHQKLFHPGAIERIRRSVAAASR